MNGLVTWMTRIGHCDLNWLQRSPHAWRRFGTFADAAKHGDSLTRVSTEPRIRSAFAGLSVDQVVPERVIVEEIVDEVDLIRDICCTVTRVGFPGFIHEVGGKRCGKILFGISFTVISGKGGGRFVIPVTVCAEYKVSVGRLIGLRPAAQVLEAIPVRVRGFPVVANLVVDGLVSPVVTIGKCFVR